MTAQASPARRAWLESRGFAPPEGLPHGTRARYVTGCRCDDCRTGNRLYARARTRRLIRGGWNGLVSAAAARQHLRALSLAGVGRRAVHEASGVSASVILLIRTGRKQTIRRETERRILGVDRAAVADHALIAARETWRRVEWLLKEGFTRAEIARRLGYQQSALQLGRARVTAKNAARVERLWQKFQEPAA